MPKISQLNPASTPLSGRETFILNQNGVTYNASLSDIKEYVDLFDSDVSGLSANWQNTYTTFSSNSGNYAKVNVDNNFTVGQTIQGPLLATQVSLSGTNLSFKRFNSTSVGITDTVTLTSTGSVLIGFNTGSNAGTSGPANYLNAIGYAAGQNVGSLGSANNLNAIGLNAGSNAGRDGSANNSNIIGYGAGSSAGRDGSANYLNAIGYGAGSNAGYLGSANDSNIIGYQAGSYAAYGGSANYLNAIGFDAGNQAGYFGSANDSNIIGYGAGRYAGYDCSVDHSNFIGYYAGNTAGGYGVGNAEYVNAIGYEAGQYVVGDRSNFIGYKTGEIAYGSDLIAIGSNAGALAGTVVNRVDESIYIGLSAGMNQRAKKNIFIGSNTNTTSPTISSLSGCIAIGYNAQPSARNTIAIGSATVPLSTIPGITLTNSVSGLKIMVNGTYFTIPLLA